MLKSTSNFLILFPFLVLMSAISLFASCSPEAAGVPEATVALPQPTATASQPTATMVQTTATSLPAAAEAVPYPLSERGDYDVGKRAFDFTDADRDGRQVGLAIWYPAIDPDNAHGISTMDDAEPDASGAPYPLLLSSSKSAGVFGSHLASHGFVVAGIRGQDASDYWGTWLIDYPQDILFALEQIATNPLDGLADIIDTANAGALGYSFDAYNSLALSGARIDPEFYLKQCAEAATVQPELPRTWVRYNCKMVEDWDEFVAHAGDSITASDDGLWQPLTDDRIQAVMPMAPEGAWLFGDRGLAAVDRPVLIIGATADTLNHYDLEAGYIFANLGTPDRVMISFVDEGHMMIYNSEPIARMKHFATAFFGYYLLGREEWEAYFSSDFVAQHDDLAWGFDAEE